jgi:hypothetical protein
VGPGMRRWICSVTAAVLPFYGCGDSAARW